MSTPTSATPRRIDWYLRAYGEDHTNRTNRVMHWIAVPIIFWCVVAMLTALPFPAALEMVPGLDWAVIAALLALYFYFRLSWPLALAMAAFMVLCIAVARTVEARSDVPLWQVALALFVVAWVLQFVGHKVEGKRPSFFSDLRFLLIGPAWLMSFLFRAFGLRY